MGTKVEWTDQQLLDLKQQAISYKGKNPALTSIVNSLGKKLDDDAWIAAFRGTRPEILPLTPRQLEAIRGGFGQLVVEDPIKRFLDPFFDPFFGP